MDLLNYVAEVSRGWDEPNKGEVGTTKSQPNAFNAKAGIYTLNEDIDMKAKVAAMTRRLEELELKKIREMQAITETPVQVMSCSICQSWRFPSQPNQNPKGIHEVEAHEGESSWVRDVNALITLRSGKEVEMPTPKPHCKSPVKYKYPGCSTISVMIGGTVVEKALLDLGASVNLLPYFVYKQLGLGKLKPTSITLSLADRSVKILRGIIEDVLVQVDNFYYPMDFVVLDTNPIVEEN
ncbi:hypothetical protein CK203_063297 [Vitis vinifera]|uniref:Uncharacterized protein n=1 Tax=Vitis vinifera TaxID=29760 RepID=A0A438G4Y4_VITVI|nr:hypothetical protein CK203_063297 [Vitis vinifera]